MNKFYYIVHRFIMIVILTVIVWACGYVFGGGNYLRSHDYPRPFAAWATQPIENVMYLAGVNGRFGHYLQRRLAAVTNSAPGYRVARWKKMFVTHIATTEWNYQHADSIYAWLIDQTNAKRQAFVWSAESAGISLFAIIAWLIFITWLKATKDRRVLTRQTRRGCLSGHQSIKVAQVPLPTESESCGILAAGVQGTGKTMFINSIVSQARVRGDSGIAIDYNGELSARFARPGDIILNHFHRRGIRWSALNESHNDFEREHLLNLFLPITGADPVHDHFQTAGQVILEPVFRRARTNLDIWRALAERDRLEALVRRTIAERYVSADTRSGGDNMTTLINALRALRYLPALAGADDKTFSIRGFVRQMRAHPGPWIWIIVPEQARRALIPLVPLWVGLAISEVLALPETLMWRFWVVTDELGQLPALADFDAALTNGRKPGLSVVSGVQVLNQIYRIYGEHQAQTILSCFHTKLILCQGNPETAEYFSRYLGEQEMHEMLRGTSSNGSTYTEHVRLKRNVLGSELLHLPKRTGYLTISPYTHAKVRLRIPHKRPQVWAPFEPRQPDSELTAGELYDKEMAEARKSMSKAAVSVIQDPAPYPSATTAKPVTPTGEALDLTALNPIGVKK